MPRPKSERHSSDLDAEITRLEQERKRLIQSEDQRRGAIIRESLRGPNGGQIRDVLRPLVDSRDCFLFGLESPSSSGGKPGESTSRATRRRVSESAQLPLAEAR
jgi:hypothetical protein